jgi:hypothetical protein
LGVQFPFIRYFQLSAYRVRTVYNFLFPLIYWGHSFSPGAGAGAGLFIFFLRITVEDKFFQIFVILSIFHI